MSYRVQVFIDFLYNWNGRQIKEDVKRTFVVESFIATVTDSSWKCKKNTSAHVSPAIDLTFSS